MESEDTTVVIAVPVSGISFEGETFVSCFIEIDIRRMLDSFSLQNDESSTTYCNLYYKNGLSLTDEVLSGRSDSRNLVEALREAEFSVGSSLEQLAADFEAGREGASAFTYRGITESVYYIPVKGTEWMLTYLIHDSMISEQINTISEGIILRSLMQTAVIAVIMLAVFGVIIWQNRRAGRLMLEKETSEALSRAKQQELEERLALQKQLLEQERQKHQSDAMITAMASDYLSVYYVDLDRDEGVCYRAASSNAYGFRQGDRFPYLKTLTDYANDYVAEEDRANLLRFIDPENICARLQKETMISCHYLTAEGGKEHYEMLRIAGVRQIKDGTDHTVHAVGIGFSDVDRETRKSMAQRRALSDALAQAEAANAAKTSFLSSMSHEIRTPMNAIIGLDSIALKDPDLSERTREQLEKIGGSARHLLGLINDVLDMSRIESGRMILKNEAFSFRDMLDQVNTMIGGQCQDKGLTYDCRIAGQVDDFYVGDEMKLNQVIINILGNAVKFTPEGGTVSLLVEPLAQFDGNAPLRFVMKDTGIGMDEAFLPKIFDAFSQEDSSRTSKYGSTGLGMAITKNIVEMMNGNISVESKKGAGTTFTVTVTLKASDQKAIPSEPDALLAADTLSRGNDGEPAKADLSGRHILLAEDMLINAEIMMEILEMRDMTVDHAENGKIAVDRFAKSAPNTYDAVLMDVRMPELDGLGATAAIRALERPDAKTVPIIALTANAFDEDMQQSLQAGMNAHLSKPVEPERLFETLERLILT